MDKKKLLIVNDTLQYGGSDLVAVRLQQNIDKDSFECVYCIRGSEPGPMEADVAKTGVRIIHQPDSELSYIKSYKYYCRLFSEEHFDIVHCHLPFYSGIVLMAAYKCGIKKRVAHSHFSKPLVLSKSKIKNTVAKLYRGFMKILINRFSTDIIGCSQDSGEYLAGKNGFRKKGMVLDNGIIADNYMFSSEKRELKRQELGVEDKIVIGHIGQMYYVKNHKYLIDVFNEFQKKHENSVLLLISDGPDRDELEQKVADLGIENKVRFLGFRTDIPDLMMAMDCFVFPSVHEGFPLTLIEAQVSKLPCVISANITQTVKLNENIVFESIDIEPEKWCDNIDKLLLQDRQAVDNSKAIEKFDIKNIAERLEKIYLK